MKRYVFRYVTVAGAERVREIMAITPEVAERQIVDARVDSLELLAELEIGPAKRTGPRAGMKRQRISC
jgi:hypothetical protein